MAVLKLIKNLSPLNPILLGKTRVPIGKKLEYLNFVEIFTL